MRALGFIVTFIAIALVIWMLLSFRKVRFISAKSCLISIGICGGILGAYAGIIGSDLPIGAHFGFLTAGIGLGIWQGTKPKVWLEEGKSVAQNTIWFLVAWALCFGASQLMAAAGAGASLNFGIGALCVGTGWILGSYGCILYRLHRLRAAPAS